MTVGWMVSVSVVKHDGRIGHKTFAVAIIDPEQAISAALKAGSGEAAVIHRKIDEAAIEGLGLKPGGVIEMWDDESDPLTGRTARH